MMGLWMLLCVVCVGAAPSGSDRPVAAQLLTPKPKCAFPAGWQGQWFQSGIPNEITITRSSISGRGDVECMEKKSDKSADKFLIFDRSQNCRQCIVAGNPQPHKNVIEFKESECWPIDDDRDMSFAELCDSITGNAPLFTMFKVHVEPESCPFGGRFSFTYRQDYRHCENPVSHAESCVKDAEMVLHYRSCPDSTEERKVRLECLGQWRRGEQQYLVGRIFHHMASSYEETFRCFMYKETRTGVQLAQSADATCRALYSATDGPQTLVMTRMSDPQPECVFPSWLTERREWQDMAADVRYVFSAAQTSFQQLAANGTADKEQLIQEGTCMQRESLDAPQSSWFRAVTFVTRGCLKGFVCHNWLRRADQIVQVQQGAFSTSLELACSEEFLNNRTVWSTLVSAKSQSIACPFPGQYLVSTPQSFNADWTASAPCSQMTRVTIGCQRHSAIQLQAHPLSEDCPTAPEDTNPMHFACHGHWMENQIGYFVATETRSARKHCFTYQVDADGSVSLSSVPSRCPSPAALSSADQFNVTEFSECSASSAARRLLSTLPLWLFCILIPWKFGVI